MNGRSTRDKIRWNVWRASDRVLEAMGNLQHAEELAGGRSQIINDSLPAIVDGLNQWHQVLLAFRDEL